MTTPRDRERAAFLARHGQADAQVASLAGDASARRYFRLTPQDATAPLVLMDADPALVDNTADFLRITGLLRDRGLSAPAIHAAETGAGFVLMEDLGDALFARVLDDAPGAEARLYHAAADLLAALHGDPADPDLPLADTDHFVAALAPFHDHFLPGIGQPADPGRRHEIDTAMHAALAAHAGPSDVMILRDFHAENLVWLPARDGAARVGLLDYQDARRGPAAYDLASLLRDARRDVSPEVAASTTARFAAATGRDAGTLSTALATLAVQRNMRILGIFHRLARDRGKPHYLDLVPRVLRDLRRDLAHRGLETLAATLIPVLPDA